jgi:hypothetical protein
MKLLLKIFNVAPSTMPFAKLPVDAPSREKTMEMVSISDSYMALLQDYSEKTGVPIDRCVPDALVDWLANVAPLTLERMGLPPLTLRKGKQVVQLVETRKRR